MTEIETMPLPDKSNGLILVEDAIVCPFFIQELKKKDSHKFTVKPFLTLTIMEYRAISFFLVCIWGNVSGIS